MRCDTDAVTDSNSNRFADGYGNANHDRQCISIGNTITDRHGTFATGARGCELHRIGEHAGL